MNGGDLAQGGWCNGPLFGPLPLVRRARPRPSGGKEVWAKWRRARPAWTTNAECAAFWEESLRRTRETGIQHSVDHRVPLLHPLVCGLHCPANLHIIPLRDNIRKSNNTWPDMWAAQGELF